METLQKSVVNPSADLVQAKKILLLKLVRFHFLSISLWQH